MSERTRGAAEAPEPRAAAHAAAAAHDTVAAPGAERSRGPVAYLTRAVEISAAHRLSSGALTEEENRRLYGKCANPNGHGHNYRIEVTVRGAVDPRTGTVIDLAALDRAIEERVTSRLDHRHLDLDVPEFQGRVSTGETIAIVVWELLDPALPAGALCRVRVVETANNAFEYQG